MMLKKIINWILNGILTLFALIGIWLLLQIFIFSSFKIPSDSMEPVLEMGDYILVSKPILGARLFNLQASMRNEQVHIYRVPGIRKIRHNDVLVFNFPHPNDWQKIEMHILKYYIKRCVGLPGDTLSIQNGMFHVSGVNYPPGNIDSEKRIAARGKNTFAEGIYRSFPYDSIMDWNIKDFGPFYIPKSGNSIVLNRTTFCLYRKLIEWEQKGILEYRDSLLFLNNKQITTYQFLKNYYFMTGDKGENSQDSRYWGLLPEEYIVGKAWIIWKSIDPYTDAFRWDRFMKRIH